MTNTQMLEAIHVFYNDQTNVLLTIQYRRGLEMYEVRRSDLDVPQLMSMQTILERRKTEQWEFLGVL